ncbi:FmdB family zinc ribbon protein [Candidatus Laterigemmans baculatus]|uniref:FmdB family zinc ribbon protein n=1 Tax=Candidatus Laterigemmans baculatus TaxID=2770505 RepID=UPI0013DA4D24|nr:zinc ribbon domain-containing protein [Candidatus Laterigemmans baculatus]
MPTYDYECDACGHSYELFQGINDPVAKKCPECGKNKLRRLFGTGAAIVFKGSGFYQTDYRSEGYKKAAAADKKTGDGGSAEKKSSGGSESKKTDSGSSTKAKPKKAD